MEIQEKKTIFMRYNLFDFVLFDTFCEMVDTNGVDLTLKELGAIDES